MSNTLLAFMILACVLGCLSVVLVAAWRLAVSRYWLAERDSQIFEGHLEEARLARRQEQEVIADLEESLREAEFGREDAQRAIKTLQRQLRELAGEESA